MMRSGSKVIVAVTTLFVLLCAGASVPGAPSRPLKAAVEALFPIASSGTVMHRDMVEPARDSIAALGPDVAPILIEMYTTRSARERHTINDILGRIGKPAVPHLTQGLRHPNGLIVSRVCWTLGEIADSSAVQPLIDVAGHRRWQVRDEALGALGDIGDSRAADVMLMAFADTVGQVRKAASVAAGKIGLAEAVPSLVHTLGDQFYGARMSSVEALMKLDTAVVIKAIADSMASANPLVADLGCLILGEFGTDEAIEVLMSQVTSDDPARRAHAAVAMIKADPLDNCGYREAILARETDRLVLLKMKSAVYSTENEQ